MIPACGGEPTDEPIYLGDVSLGTHLEGELSPDDYVPLIDRGDAPIVLGANNGAWMLVLAAHAPHTPDDVKTVTVEGSILDTETGAAYANVIYKKRSLVRNDDGAWLLNQFLIVPDDLSWQDRAVDVMLRLTAETTPKQVQEGRLRLVLRRDDPRSP